MKASRIVLLGLVLAGAAGAAEVVRQFSAQVAVRPDARLAVTETINVNAEGRSIKRGIFRDFPTRYRTASGLDVQVGFRVLGATRDGRPEPWHTENLANGVRVYLGSADVMLNPGEHRYELTYETDHQLGFFADHDELYWNVTGNGWALPIEHASAAVRLPAGATVQATTGYTGPQGARGKDFTTELPDRAAQPVRFATTRTLRPGEGLTVVVTWPKGFVKPEPKPTAASRVVRANPGVGVAALGLLVTLAYFLWAWWRVGRDPPAGTIIPLYDPPAGLSPAAVRHLVRMGSDRRCFVANLVDLAVRGALQIGQTGKDYRLVRQNRSAPMTDDEAAMFWLLFAGGETLAMDQENHGTLLGARDAMDRKLQQHLRTSFYSRNSGWWMIGVLLSLVPVFAAGSLWPVPVLVVVVAIDAVFFHLLKAPSVEGRALLDRIAGFKLYLGVAEGDRLNLENPPERTPELFDRFLPYALALDVEQRWCDQFADVFAGIDAAGDQPPLPDGRVYHPAWYSGSGFAAGRLADFGQSLGSSFDGAIAAASTPPGTSSGMDSGGSSGGGGGGSSGGGGGGGGGGGW